MTSTNCTQNKYDHRLRELVRSTGDIEHAIRLGVPRSTARGWLTSAPVDVITLDVVDMDNLRLQQEVLKLRARLGWVIAILRLFVVVLKTSDVSLSNIRLPQGTAKRMLLRTIGRSSCVLPLNVALRVIGLSHSRYHTWKQKEECGLDEYRIHPTQIPSQSPASPLRYHQRGNSPSASETPHPPSLHAESSPQQSLAHVNRTGLCVSGEGQRLGNYHLASREWNR
jgi:hypothetical protein